MKETERRAYAKVNLALDVLARREDGYHDIRSVMHAIDLYDRVIIRLIERGEIGAEADDKLQLVVSSDLPGLPGGEQNIAAKAARCFLAQQPAPESVVAIDIHLEKRIPVGAGLGGGSADAAAVLLGLNELFGTGGKPLLEQSILMKMAAQAGADVPFCLLSQQGVSCALAEGIGEQLMPLPELRGWAVLACPPFQLDTAQVYQAFDDIHETEKVLPRPDFERLREGLKNQNWAAVEKGTGNALWPASRTLLPELEQLAGDFTKVVLETAASSAGRVLPKMSGSGPSLFALFCDQNEAEQVRRRFSYSLEDVFIIRLGLDKNRA